MRKLVLALGGLLFPGAPQAQAASFWIFGERGVDAQRPVTICQRLQGQMRARFQVYRANMRSGATYGNARGGASLASGGRQASATMRVGLTIIGPGAAVVPSPGTAANPAQQFRAEQRTILRAMTRAGCR